jgi:hypothetical protein
MNSMFVDRAVRIQAAIEAAWDMAGLLPDYENPRIIPLDALIRSFPLAVEEVFKLTLRSAAQVLSARSGDRISPPTNGADVDLAGYLYAYPYRGSVQGYVLIEQKDIVERRRFSVAHELGHYLLHFLPQIAEQQKSGVHLNMTESMTYGTNGDAPDVPTGKTIYTREGGTPTAPRPAEQGRMEAEANQFAAELLMPTPACRTLLARFGSRASPRRLATEFLVSPAAMRWRLRELGMGIE